MAKRLTKTAYYITAKKTVNENDRIVNHDRSQYLLPNELHLIKTMLTDGVEITGVRKDELSQEQFKALFGY